MMAPDEIHSPAPARESGHLDELGELDEPLLGSERVHRPRMGPASSHDGPSSGRDANSGRENAMSGGASPHISFGNPRDVSLFYLLLPKACCFCCT